MVGRLLDVLFPPHCVGCGTSSAWWCDACDVQAVPIFTPRCLGCKAITTHGQCCGRCQRRWSLAGVSSGLEYRPPVDRAIQTVKYRHARRAAASLVGDLLAALEDARLPSTALVVPIPLHRSRQRQRGHNQALEIARLLSKHTGWPLAPSLHRTGKTLSQTGLNRAQRIANVAGAFEWLGGSLSGQTVVLVDDVITTGATLEGAAAALKVACARRVWGATIAKA